MSRFPTFDSKQRVWKSGTHTAPSHLQNSNTCTKRTLKKTTTMSHLVALPFVHPPPTPEHHSDPKNITPKKHPTTTTPKQTPTRQKPPENPNNPSNNPKEPRSPPLRDSRLPWDTKPISSAGRMGGYWQRELSSRMPKSQNRNDLK